MTISKPTFHPLSILFLLIFSINSFSQKLKPIERIPIPDHTVKSKIMGKEYQLFISFPSSYSTKDTISYPVLYVLDGERDFDLFYHANKFFSKNEQMEEIIIVGIGSGADVKSRVINRGNDFTPSPSTDSIEKKERAKKFDLPIASLTSGGAANFLSTLKTEIIPFIDKNYKTNTDRGITGHSLGGLFTTYCLLNSDGYFTRFGINSPSLWWNNKEVMEQAILQFNGNKIWNLPATKVYISVGGADGNGILITTTVFAAHLQKADYKNIDLNWHVFDNETHDSVIPLSLRQTIIKLYKKQ